MAATPRCSYGFVCRFLSRPSHSCTVVFAVSRPGPQPGAGKTSQFHGVSRIQQGGWAAHFTLLGDKKNLGRFKTERAAAEAYDERARLTNLPVNFPKPGELKAGRGVVRASKYIGVQYNARKQRWDAFVTTCQPGSGQKKREVVGWSRHETQAALMRDAAALKNVNLKYPKLNFKPTRQVSKFSGVAWHRGKGKWAVTISYQAESRCKVTETAGYRTDEEEAGKLYDMALLTRTSGACKH